jgi:hypothetical protein
MPHFFKHFPTVSYDVKKNNKPVILTNVMLRFKIAEVLKNRTAVYYDYTVKESDTPTSIADKYYGDATLDWIIFLANDIVDPLYDWPLDQNSLNTFIINKYGSVAAAQAQVHHYEKIIRTASTYRSDTPVKEKSIHVDETTYLTLDASVRREVTNYEYEIELNESKREIKLLDERYLATLLSEFRAVLR